MSIALQNEVNALKAKVAELEARLQGAASIVKHDVVAGWDDLVARIEALEAHAKTLRLKVRP